MWDKSVIEDVLARTDLAALVGGRVDLRRSGSSLKGLCPFHSDRNPSFHVYPDSGNCICYSCGWRGDALDYLEQAEGLGFTDALPRLASLAGVALPEPEEAPPTRPAAPNQREALKDGHGAQRRRAGRGPAPTVSAVCLRLHAADTSAPWIDLKR